MEPMGAIHNTRAKLINFIQIKEKSRLFFQKRGKTCVLSATITWFMAFQRHLSTGMAARKTMPHMWGKPHFPLMYGIVLFA
jgi:hypothetical protein